MVKAQLEYCICVEGTENNHEHVIQDNRFQDEDMNQAPCNYNAELVPTGPRCPVNWDQFPTEVAICITLQLCSDHPWGPPSLHSPSLEAKEQGHIPDLSPLSTAKVSNAQSLVHTPSMLYHGAVYKHGSAFSVREIGGESHHLCITCHFPPKCWCPSTRLHGVTGHETTIKISMLT